MATAVNHAPHYEERYAPIERVMARYAYRRKSLLEVLNTVQATFGYLPEEVLRVTSAGWLVQAVAMLPLSCVSFG